MLKNLFAKLKHMQKNRNNRNYNNINNLKLIERIKMIARKPDFKEEYVFVKTLKRIKN